MRWRHVSCFQHVFPLRTQQHACLIRSPLSEIPRVARSHAYNMRNNQRQDTGPIRKPCDTGACRYSPECGLEPSGLAYWPGHWTLWEAGREQPAEPRQQAWGLSACWRGPCRVHGPAQAAYGSPSEGQSACCLGE